VSRTILALAGAIAALRAASVFAVTWFAGARHAGDDCVIRAPRSLSHPRGLGRILRRAGTVDLRLPRREWTGRSAAEDVARCLSGIARGMHGGCC
jgi:hypothetical protein